MDLKRLSSVGIIIFLVFFLLYLGKSFFIPFSIAIAAWYLIITLSAAYSSLGIHGFRFSRPLAILLAIFTLILGLAILVSLLNSNIGRVIELAPDYEAKFKNLSYNFLDMAGFDASLGLRQILDSIDMRGLMLQLTKVFTTTASSLVMIIVYTLFLLLEYRNFGKKLRQVFAEEAAYERFFLSLRAIDQDIRTYLRIKTISSLSTALISFLILYLVGVDLAVFWALLIYILNYIPTIGSIIAVIFPLTISLIQFDSFLPFLIVLTSLTLIQVMIGSIIEPRFMGKSLNLSPLVILASLTLWGSIWGVVGMFLSVPIMSITNIVLSKFSPTRPLAIMLSANGKI